MKYFLLLLIIGILANLFVAALVSQKWMTGAVFLAAYLRVTWLFLKR